MRTISKQRTLDRLGENIRVLRDGHGYTQERFAQKLGLHQASLSRVEKGRQALLPHHLLLCARVFNLPVTSLLVRKLDKAGLAAQGVRKFS